MKKKIVTLIVSGAIILSAVAYFAFRPAGQVIANVLPQEMSAGSNTLQYPVIEDLPDKAVQDKLNGVIQQEMNQFAENLSKPQYSGRTDYLVQFNKDSILSIVITESSYAKGAAHPMSYLRAFTMNTRTGQIYKLADLFKPGQDYATVINTAIEQQIAERQVTMLRPFKAIGDNQEFYLTGENLVVYYQLYEYTPYVYGFPKFTVPYSQIAGMLNPDVAGAVKLAAKK